MMSTQKNHIADDIGRFLPQKTSSNILKAGEVGYLITGIQNIHGARVGDTITTAKSPASEPLAGFKTIKPQVLQAFTPPIQTCTSHLELLWKNCALMMHLYF